MRMATLRSGRAQALVLLLLLVVAFAGCGASGDECDRCSGDNDCTAGFVCSTFDDGSKRCGTGMGTTCRVR